MIFQPPSTFAMAAQPNDADQPDVERFETRTNTSWTSTADEQDVRSQDSPRTNETDDTSQSGSQQGHGPQLVENEPPLVLVEPPITAARPPIIYIPIPSPGDPQPLIPSRPFTIGPVAPLPTRTIPKPSGHSLLTHATQSVSDTQQRTGPQRLTQTVLFVVPEIRPSATASGSNMDVNVPSEQESDVDIPVVNPRP